MNKLNYTHRTLSFTWLNTVNLAAYLTWLTVTGMGALLGSLITEPDQFGFQFAITAMFIGLLYLQIISDKMIQIKLQVEVILFVLLLTYFGMAFIPGNLLILVVTLLGCMLGVTLINFILWTIFATGLVTWLSRIIPFVLLKRFTLSPTVIEF
ncbi:hypothetical protein IV43_GL000681 [Ligilactobacillus acidipiscis]|uniref:Uncharacterized protein n=1 Tax=Ligilactobacillus acidipiscis TaxID=89059 RepID=A0A0R2JKA3_9LACO|nr:hypothetical protein IV43_GL000681 [Ligilactobacillus acidipiscis]